MRGELSQKMTAPSHNKVRSQHIHTFTSRENTWLVRDAAIDRSGEKTKALSLPFIYLFL